MAAVALLAGAAGCSRDGDDDEEIGDAALGSSTTASTLSFEEADTAVTLNTAATGMNIVATEVGLRARQEGGADYCRTGAPAELAPHRAALEAAADDEVRERAGAALARVQEAIDLCAGGSDAMAVEDALTAYTTSFEHLRERLDVLLDGG